MQVNMKQNDIQVQKRRRVVIFGVCVVLVIVILITLCFVLHPKISANQVLGKDRSSGVYISPGIATDSSRQVINSDTLNNQCVGDICLKEVKITCYSNKGLVEYQLENNGSTSASGYVKLVLGTYDAIVFYNNIGAGATQTGYYGYDD